ncbi:hypothetical protein [Streptomyces sp. NPDC057617]
MTAIDGGESWLTAAYALRLRGLEPPTLEAPERAVGVAAHPVTRGA